MLEHTRLQAIGHPPAFSAALAQHSLDCALRNTQPDSFKLVHSHHLVSSRFPPPSVTQLHSHTTYAHHARHRPKRSQLIFPSHACPFFLSRIQMCQWDQNTFCDYTDQTEQETSTRTREGTRAPLSPLTSRRKKVSSGGVGDGGKQNKQGRSVC